jgi:hypothetical protein
MALNLGDVDSCIQDLIDLTEEYKTLEVWPFIKIMCIALYLQIFYLYLQKNHKSYTAKLEELSEAQSKCVKDVSHQRYRLGLIRTTLKKFVDFP